MADFSLSLDVLQILDPGIEIDTGGAGALDFAQRLDHCVVKMSDVIGSDAAAKRNLQLLEQLRRSVTGATYFRQCIRCGFTVRESGQGDRPKRRKLEWKRIDIVLVRKILARKYRCGI